MFDAVQCELHSIQQLSQENPIHNDATELLKM